MIGYCPLEELEPPTRPQETVVVEKPKSSVGLEETECNYAVMAFIMGVVILALADSMDK
jgi:hypothetical protein|tara:strand:+ start:1886 stop:2062 length:177 start_codon:yes stop_codon:yes gene_type:complete